MSGNKQGINRYRAHQNLVKEFKLKAQKEIPKIRIFDRTVGLFYTKRGVPVKIGHNGMSDCYAYYNTGNGILLIDIEFKTGNARQSKDQKIWQQFVEGMSGYYIIVREDVDKAINEIKEYLGEKGISL